MYACIHDACMYGCVHPCTTSPEIGGTAAKRTTTPPHRGDRRASLPQEGWMGGPGDLHYMRASKLNSAPPSVVWQCWPENYAFTDLSCRQARAVVAQKSMTRSWASRRRWKCIIAHVVGTIQILGQIFPVIFSRVLQI